MPSNSNVLINREDFIGGSDIPIIMNLSPFKTRFQLLQEKAGIIDSSETENKFTDKYKEFGDHMEPKIRDYINSLKLFDEFKEGTFYDDNDPMIRCNVDGFNKDVILEIKTTSQIHENLNDYKLYLVQILYYMEHTGRKQGLLAVYERGEDFNEEFDEKKLHTYDIELDKFSDLVDKINYAVELFKSDLEKVKANNFTTEEDLLPQEVKHLAAGIRTLESKVAEAKKAEEQYAELKAKLYEVMEIYGIKTWTTPNNVKITRIEPKPKTVTTYEAFDEDKFKEEHPKTYKKYLVEKEKINSGKAGYIKITLPKEAKDETL